MGVPGCVHVCVVYDLLHIMYVLGCVCCVLPMRACVCVRVYFVLCFVLCVVFVCARVRYVWFVWCVRYKQYVRYVR